MNPFDVVNDLSYNKVGILDETNIKEYNPFLTNRAFSYFMDTLYYAQEMNIYGANIDKDMQYAYYMNAIPKKKRFAKWGKKVVNEDIAVISKFYKCNNKRAEEYLKLMSKDRLAEIRKMMSDGESN